MDEIWKSIGLDLRLTLYRVMSTDACEGFIEIVANADTVCRIQTKQQLEGSGSKQLDSSLKSAGAVFRKGLLLSWLRQQNRGEGEMQKAQEEFTRSCAGYVVATYILVGQILNSLISSVSRYRACHNDKGRNG